jgi:diketogulonate reductase-like aldo/keto reductase
LINLPCVVTKLWRVDFPKEKIEQALKKSLKNLGLDYADMYLVHFIVPLFDYTQDPPEPLSPSLEEMWKVFEGFVDDGLTKHIGVSNSTVWLCTTCWRTAESDQQTTKLR